MLLLFLLLACADLPTPPSAPPTLTLGATRTATPRVLARGPWDDPRPWGPAGGGFGRDTEGPIGPMAVLSDGPGWAVLDQENLRILRFDAGGAPLPAVPIPHRATVDGVRTARGFALLSYEREPSPRWMVQSVDLEGTADSPVWLPEMEPPTGVFAWEDRILVEEAHGALVDPSTGQRYPGRPDGSGWFVSARKEGDQDLLLTWSDADGDDRRRVRLAMDRTLSNVVALDLLPSVAVVTLLLYEEGPAPRFAMLEPELRVVAVDRKGHRRDEISLPVGLETTMYRHVTLGPDRQVLRLRTDAEGVAVDALPLEVEP